MTAELLWHVQNIVVIWWIYMVLKQIFSTMLFSIEHFMLIPKLTHFDMSTGLKFYYNWLFDCSNCGGCSLSARSASLFTVSSVLVGTSSIFVGSSEGSEEELVAKASVFKSLGDVTPETRWPVKEKKDDLEQWYWTLNSLRRSDAYMRQ